ncbi:hypothetical protein UCDDS831_g00745 [Diplodia seriata]|uniref:Uncharacterized protein n=1 Tax=Diplodia seriata TaxID=420778 RepID=A0A0G2EZI8_9PEZI|nr:hypothetical protein UCDDS831_g00745 [Diplodia seriata]
MADKHTPHPGGQGVANPAPDVQQSASNSSVAEKAREYRLDRTRPCFLDLPPEIRNEIYHWTLLVAPTGPPPPLPLMKRVPDKMFSRVSVNMSRTIRKFEANYAEKVLEMTESDFVHFTGSRHLEPCSMAQWNPVGTMDPPVLVKAIEGGGLTPGLLAVNKQVNSEAAPFLYARNKFKVEDCVTRRNALQRFVEVIGPCNASYITHLRLVCIADCSLPRNVDLNQPEWIQWIQTKNHSELIVGDPLDKTLLAMTSLETMEFKFTRRWFGDHVDTDGAAMKIFSLIREWLDATAAREGDSQALERLKLFTWDTHRIAESDKSDELRSFLERVIATSRLQLNA